MRRPKPITLTLVNRSELTRELVDKFRAMMKRLFRRDLWADRITGGIYSLEVTNEGNGWHLHAHIIAGGAFIPRLICRTRGAKSPVTPTLWTFALFTTGPRCCGIASVIW